MSVSVVSPISSSDTPPTVSVVMAAHNAAHYLPEALQSLARQTFTDFELILVEDGSTDATGSIVAAFAAADPRARVLHNERNLGMAPSLNRGLSQARGRYIARHDADDLSAPTRLQEQVNFLERHPEVGLLGTGVQIISADGQPLDIDPYAGGGTDAALQAELLDHNSLCHGSVMLRGACLAQVGVYDEGLELTEDYDLWLRLAEVTALAKLPNRLYDYRQHAGSISNQRRGQQMVAQARTLEKAMRRRHGATPSARLLEHVADNYRQAADYFVQQGDLAAARDCLTQAITLCPALFATGQVYVPVPSGAEDLAFAESVLANLASTTQYERVRRTVRSRVHMRRVFAAASRGDMHELRTHLWAGVYQDPRWLLNRGIWSLTARAVFGRPRRRAAPPASNAPASSKDKPA